MTTNLRRKRRTVQQIDPRRQAIVEQMNGLAWLLDNSIKLPILNYNIGLDAIIGLIPGLGDVAGLVLSSVIVLQAIRLGAPRDTLARMVLNIVAEAFIGMIPLLGDIFDATFKANVRNVQLLSLAVGETRTGRPLSRAAGRGTIAAVIAVLVGLIVLIGAAGIVLFWGVLALFR